MAKQAKQKISETREDINEEIRNLNREQLSPERQKRLVSEVKRAVIKLKEIEARNKRGEKYQLKLKDFKELNVLNNKNIKTDAYQQKADEEKDSISMEMAWAQVDGKVSVLFEDMAKLVRPTRREEFFNKLKFDTGLKRDLVGMTVVIEHVKNRQFDKALYAMAYFNVKDRMFEMEQFFNVTFGAEFKNQVTKFFNMAETNNLSESQIKDIAGQNMNFATGTMNEIKSTFASALTGEDMSALSYAVSSTYSNARVSETAPHDSIQAIVSMFKSFDSEKIPPMEYKKTIEDLSNKMKVGKTELLSKSPKVISEAFHCLDLLNDEKSEILTEHTKTIEAALDEIREEPKTSPKRKKILKNVNVKFSMAHGMLVSQLGSFSFKQKKSIIDKYRGNDEGCYQLELNREKIKATESAKIAIDLKIAQLDEEIKILQDKLNSVTDEQEQLAIQEKLKGLKSERQSLATSRMSYYSEKVKLNGKVSGMIAADITVSRKLNAEKQELIQKLEEVKAREHTPEEITEIEAKIEDIDLKIKKLNVRQELLDNYEDTRIPITFRDYKTLDMKTIVTESQKDPDDAIDYVVDAKRDKSACISGIHITKQLLEELKQNPEANQKKIKEYEDKIKFYQDKIQEIDEFLERYGNYRREEIVNEKIDNINKSFSIIETEKDLEKLDDHFESLRANIDKYIALSNRKLKVEVLTGFVERLTNLIELAAQKKSDLSIDQKARFAALTVWANGTTCRKTLQEKIIELQTGKSVKQQTFAKKEKPPEEEKRDHIRTIQDNQLYSVDERDDGTTRMKEVSKDEAGKRINRISNAINGILKHRNILTIEDIEYCEKNVDMCVQYLEECKTNTETQFKGITKLRETVKQMQEKVAKARENLERGKTEGSSEREVSETSEQSQEQPEETEQQTETSGSQETETGHETENENQSEKVGGFTLAGEANPDATILEVEASPLPEPEGQTTALERELTEEELAAQASNKK